MYAAGATERATDRRRTRASGAARRGAQTDDGWRDVSSGFYYGHFFLRAPRARYQYYHNFTFVIGWHRASVTCRAPFASPFSVSLSFFEPFILSSGCSLCPFLPPLSLPLSPRPFSLLFLRLAPSRFSLSFSFSFLCRYRFRDPRPRALLARFWSLFVTPAIVP